jgi:hypothetical protein
MKHERKKFRVGDDFQYGDDELLEVMPTKILTEMIFGKYSEI